MLKTSTRNWWAFFLDYVFFGLALTFAQTGTVLPAFAATLTTSKALIGAASAIWLGAWLLPQLFAANFLTNKPKKYPYMVLGAVMGRPMFWLFALLLFTGWLAKFPGVLLVIFLFGLGWFALTDAFTAIAWFDLFGKAMSPQRRGRLVGLGQVVVGLLSIGAGWLVGQLLSNTGPPYPLNYAAIFALAGLCVFFSFLAILITVEIPEAVPVDPPAASLREFLPRFAAVWRSDPTFVRVITVQLLAGLQRLASSFYILHATQVAGIDPAIVGGLAAVGSIGIAVAGLVLGQVAVQRGSHRVIQIVTWLSLAPPLLGLGVSLIRVASSLTWVYVACYFIIGMVEGSNFIGFSNYILDLAPPGGRPVYIGLANSFAGALVIAPIIGGWILDHTSYPALFIITFVAVIPAALLAMRLPPIAHKEAVEPPEPEFAA